MATTLNINAIRLNMIDPLPTSPSYGLKSGIFKPPGAWPFPPKPAAIASPLIATSIPMRSGK